jgi:hypothetical protein
VCVNGRTNEIRGSDYGFVRSRNPATNWVFPWDVVRCVELISPYITAAFIYADEIKLNKRNTSEGRVVSCGLAVHWENAVTHISARYCVSLTVAYLSSDKFFHSNPVK